MATNVLRFLENTKRIDVKLPYYKLGKSQGMFHGILRRLGQLVSLPYCPLMFRLHLIMDRESFSNSDVVTLVTINY